jgi:hypothetical protein
MPDETNHPTTRTGPARAALAEAVREDLHTVAAQIAGAAELLEALHHDSGGINGLSTRCRAIAQQLRGLEESVERAGGEYHESLTATRPVAIAVESVDEEQAQRVREARAAEGDGVAA